MEYTEQSLYIINIFEPALLEDLGEVMEAPDSLSRRYSHAHVFRVLEKQHQT